MLSNYMGILSLNEKDDNIKTLTRTRPIASIPFAGRYRVIDFVLSNMVNCGISNIGIFTQGNSRSLVDHLGSGKPWDLDRKFNGLFVFNFGPVSTNFNDIEMLKNNIEYLYRSKQEYVILAPSFMVCNINYEEAAKFHEEAKADITIIYKKINNGKTSFPEADILNIDENNNVVGVGKNIGVEDELNVSMEMVILKKELLLNLVYECVKTGFWTNIKDFIYMNTLKYKVKGFEFNGYVERISSINSYYKSNMDTLDLKVNKELFYNNGLIYTKIMDEAPTNYAKSSNVSNSLIANGCIIEGKVENCILSRRVIVHKGAKLKNCIIMQNCEIKANASLTNVIIDKNVTIDEGKELKGDEQFPLVIEKKALF